MPRKSYTLHLAKGDVARFENLLSGSAQDKLLAPNTQSVEIPDFAEGAHLYIFDGISSPPKWFRELNMQFGGLRQIQTKSSSSVLFFRRDNRIFAVTFSHGWMHLNEANFEGDFGLRVAINALDESKLRRLERANLGDAMRAVSLSPFQRDFKSFGLDEVLDLVRKIGGNTKDAVTADSLSGARSLKVTGEFALNGLPDIASEALGFYTATDYQRTSFKIIDVVTPVTDKRSVSDLDDLVVASIRDRHDDFEIGLPTDYDDDEVSFKFIGPGKRGVHPDLLLRAYVEIMGDKIQAITAQTLRDHKILAVFDDGVKPDQSWSLRSALVGSVVHNNGQYALNEGEWYKLDDAFKVSVENTCRDLILEWDEDPVPIRKVYDADGNGKYQSEESYNQETADRLGFLCLDRKMVPVDGVERSSFEACDLLDIDGKRLIHVKKNSRRSSVLSHLFKQGANSAHNIKRFPPVKDTILQILNDNFGQGHADRLRATFDDGRKWSVEYWIADTPRQNGEFDIPFFSKVTLREETSRLNAMEYNVGVRFIGQQLD